MKQLNLDSDRTISAPVLIEEDISVPRDNAIYDSKMNCVATSLEKNPRNTIILPENGRIAFVGEAGAEFQIRLS